MLQGILFKSARRRIGVNFFQGAKRNPDVFATFSASRICIFFAQYKTVGLWSLAPKIGTEVQRICSGSEILSLLWSVNLLSQVCRLTLIKLSWKARIPIHFTLSPVIFISVITSIIFSSPGEIPTNAIDSPRRVVVGYIECRLRSSISVPKYKYDMREKQRGGDIIFSITELFPLLVLCWFASRLWNILILCEKCTAVIRWPPRRVTALQVVGTSSLGPRLPGLTFVFNFSWELQSPQGRPKTML